MYICVCVCVHYSIFQEFEHRFYITDEQVSVRELCSQLVKAIFCLASECGFFFLYFTAILPTVTQRISNESTYPLFPGISKDPEENAREEEKLSSLSLL